MNKLTRFIGSIVVAALLYAIPVLATCAIIFDWGVTPGLLMLAVVDFCCLASLICVKAEEDE